MWQVLFLFFFIGGAYSTSERLVSAGFENGDLKIFDLRTMNVHWETNVGNGVIKCNKICYNLFQVIDKLLYFIWCIRFAAYSLTGKTSNRINLQFAP